MGEFAGTSLPFLDTVLKFSRQFLMQIRFACVSFTTFGRLSNHNFDYVPYQLPKEKKKCITRQADIQ